MKRFCFHVGISAYGFACAQQSPAILSGPSGEMLAGISILRPEYAPSPAIMPPRNPTAVNSPRTQHELTDLIRAQTEAIRALTSKVNSLDERLRKIEGKLR
jgi:hypothetical protein